MVLKLGRAVYDPPTRSAGRAFNARAIVAEADLIPLHTREAMLVAKVKGHLRDQQPKLNRRQEVHLASLWRSGEYTTAELSDPFGVARSAVYRYILRQGGETPTVSRSPATSIPA